MGRFSVIDNNILDKQGVLNILKHFIFGNSDVSIYDQNRTYNFGDKSFIIDTITGDISVVTATANNVTGPYDESKWNNVTLADTVVNGSDKVVIISKYRPRESITKLWLTPDEFSTHYITIPDFEPGTEPDIPIDPDIPVDPDTKGIIMLFSESEIPLVEDTDTADLTSLDIGHLVFDIEGEGIMSIEGLTSIEGETQIIVDEQEDIVVNNDKPVSNDYAILWIDTDLSDDIW